MPGCGPSFLEFVGEYRWVGECQPGSEQNNSATPKPGCLHAAFIALPNNEANIPESFVGSITSTTTRTRTRTRGTKPTATIYKRYIPWSVQTRDSGLRVMLRF